MPLGGFAPCPLPLGGTAVDGLTAEQHARIAADLKAVVAAAPFAILTFDTDSATPIAYTAQHNVGVVSAPTITLVGPGVVTLTWQGSYLDEYDNAFPVYIKAATATAHHSVLFAGATATVRLIDARTLGVYTLNPSTGAVDTRVTVAVW